MPIAIRALATTLVSRNGAEPELLSTCFEGAGQIEEAARYAALAAERAERGMAFDRAAELYKRALELGSSAAAERHAHLIAMAEALANAWARERGCRCVSASGYRRSRQ